VFLYWPLIIERLFVNGVIKGASKLSELGWEDAWCNTNVYEEKVNLRGTFQLDSAAKILELETNNQ